jgi:transcriptional regulator GlxA family with amidase domain
VASLVTDTGFSVRQIQRHFDDAVGVSPKQLLRIMRFNSARRALLGSPSTPLLEVAHASRYADYSHMSHDFKEFLGLTPHEFKRWIRPRVGADLEDVAFLQDDCLSDWVG